MLVRNKTLLSIFLIAIIISTVLYTNNILDLHKNTSIVMSDNNINFTIKSDLVSLRSYSGISSQLLNDGISIINSDSLASRNRFYYAKYYYTICLNKIKDIENNINSIPNLSSSKNMSQLLTSIQEEKIVLQDLCDNIDELIVSIDRRVHSSQILIDNLKYKSNNLLAFLNNIIESYDF